MHPAQRLAPLFILWTVLLPFHAAAQPCTSPTFEGHTYDVVQIGDQCWYAENSRYLPQVNNNHSTTSPRYYVQGYTGTNLSDALAHANYSTYGVMYNFAAVQTAVCPTGWNVPSADDWNELSTFLGADAGQQLKADGNIWGGSAGPGLSGTDGFYALPHGRNLENSGATGVGTLGWFASSTVDSGDNQRSMQVRLKNDDVNVLVNSQLKKNGVALRCVTAASAASVPGCMDNSACNYNAAANSDDGSCTYATTWYADADGDGLGDAADSQSSCTQPAGYVADSSDNCDDLTAYNYADPNNAACDTDFSCGEGFSYNGAHYATVQIGDQCWFQESLRTTEYRDGTSIPGGLSNSDWSSDTDGAYHQYSSNVSVYGLLYNYYAVTNSAGLCPTGWEVPSDEDWQSLEISQGMSVSDAAQTGWRGASQNVGGKLKNTGTTYWNSPNSGATNSSGFTANGAGRRFDTGSTGNFKKNSFFWTNSSYTLNNGWSRYMAMDNTGIKRVTYDKNYGFAVRCLLAAAGCTDDGACNYDASAISDDGTCTYTATWYADADGDGLGDASDSQSSCTQPSGYVANSNDNCDDPDANNYADSNNTACDTDFTCGEGFSFDGHHYSTVAIGDHCWFSQNLRSTSYANGESIPRIYDQPDWDNATSGAYAHYQNNSAFIDTDGRLYNWYAATDSRGMCPTGWHVPTDENWMALEAAAGVPDDELELTGFRGVDENAGYKLKSTSGWNNSGGGDNSLGFNAKAPGRRGTDGFHFRKSIGYYWTSSLDGSMPWFRILNKTSDGIHRLTGSSLNSGFSVRCIRSVDGCTDDGACNYDASATVDDGSCTYATTWYADDDGDGMGDPGDSQSSCSQPAGYVADSSDNCDDVTAYNYADPNNAACDTEFSCGEGFSYEGFHYGTLDFDGKCWFASNLHTTIYADGTPIPTDLSIDDWTTASEGAYHEYSSDIESYGLLYNYYATISTHGLCPTSWMVPSDDHWKSLEISVGMTPADAELSSWDQYRGESENIGGILKEAGTTFWDSPNSGATNSSGFGARGAGRRQIVHDQMQLNQYAYFWTTSISPDDASRAYLRKLGYDNSYVLRLTHPKENGHSVRCIRSVDGCTDNGACNYNSSATVDDGSCTYATTWYADDDGDGMGDPGDSQSSCTQPTGYVADSSDNCDDLAALNYALTPAESCAYSCDELDAPLTYTGIALSSAATGPAASDGAVSLTFSGGYGSKTVHFTAGTPHTIGAHSFTLAASLTAIPHGHWSTYLVDEAGCEGRCDGCGSSARVTLDVVVPHDRCD